MNKNSKFYLERDNSGIIINGEPFLDLSAALRIRVEPRKRFSQATDYTPAYILKHSLPLPPGFSECSIYHSSCHSNLPSTREICQEVSECLLTSHYKLNQGDGPRKFEPQVTRGIPELGLSSSNCHTLSTGRRDPRYI
ncbi:hypothetical protein TNCV_1076891 [Trichonephila clavipes]|uniref:Uncharacterized protein n=1 Tax=Trichonephila clavipes TaxID=2585209 RepID=A0A8X6V2Z0_TRICX|nr:hypothetical protein TNCV_1076891 [Trichonephila clavipes]